MSKHRLFQSNAQRIVLIFRVLTLSVLVLWTFQTASAQTANDVVVTLKAQKVLRSADGKEILKVADRAVPGEVIQYDAQYKNQSKKGIRNLEPTLPIPSGLQYVADSASPPPAKASLDGKTFAPVPLKRQVTMPTVRSRKNLCPCPNIARCAGKLAISSPDAPL